MFTVAGAPDILDGGVESLNEWLDSSGEYDHPTSGPSRTTVRLIQSKRPKPSPEHLLCWVHTESQAGNSLSWQSLDPRIVLPGCQVAHTQVFALDAKRNFERLAAHGTVWFRWPGS